MCAAVVQDLPDGNYAELKKKGEMKNHPGREFWVGISNYRTLCLMLTYGYCFGTHPPPTHSVANVFLCPFPLPLFDQQSPHALISTELAACFRVQGVSNVSHLCLSRCVQCRRGADLG